jgi:hypothetical protein
LAPTWNLTYTTRMKIFRMSLMFMIPQLQSGSEKSDLYSEDDGGDGWDKDFEDDDIDISDDEEFHALDEMYGSAP